MNLDIIKNKVIGKITKKAFNKENPTELFSQLMKVVQRDFNDPKVNEIIKGLKEISSDLAKLKK